MTRLAIHSTRLFPKGRGANHYRVSGIASRCDWILFSDREPPHVFLHKAKRSGAPRTIFLSMRAHVPALRYFAESVLPALKAPVVLISGSEDVTLPNQIDKRWSPLNEHLQNCVNIILDSAMVRCWAVENLDEITHSKLFPLPLGMVFSGEPKIRETIDIPDVLAAASRSPRVLCAHRIRDGEQWNVRRKLSEFARKDWAAFCTQFDEELPEADYLTLVEEHAFVICAQGGGVDPSPKAWQAILHGAIPIIKSSALDAAYRHLPVVFVDEWTPDSISLASLQSWQRELSTDQTPCFHREEVLRRLGLDYWWKYITEFSPGRPLQRGADDLGRSGRTRQE